MPFELIAGKPGHAVLQEYDEPGLQPDQVRIHSLFSSVKHGTEFRAFRGDSADACERWDPELRLHRRGERPQPPFPMRLGNMCLGEVVEVGKAVGSLAVGVRVFGHMPVRETHVVAEGAVDVAPESVSPQALMYWDPADYAVGGVRDGHVRLGDRVAVFGLGAIGQMLAQASRVAGARWVAVTDPIQRRRDAAARHGVDLVLDPGEVDAGLAIKERTDGIGVDVAIEASGFAEALNDALRAVRYEGTVVSTAYYMGPMDGLFMSGEWHRNRIQIISSRACSEPLPEYGWDFSRVRSESLALLTEGRLSADDLIDPIVPFHRAAESYMAVFENPGTSIKLGIHH
jgi:2-desacetyl-2-hydroxyethyl bacteriochlorophyllide A dehydrogenase